VCPGRDLPVPCQPGRRPPGAFPSHRHVKIWGKGFFLVKTEENQSFWFSFASHLSKMREGQQHTGQKMMKRWGKVFLRVTQALSKSDVHIGGGKPMRKDHRPPKNRRGEVEPRPRASGTTTLQEKTVEDEGFLQAQSFLSMRNKRRFTPSQESEVSAFVLSENFLLHFRKKQSYREETGWVDARFPTAPGCPQHRHELPAPGSTPEGPGPHPPPS